MVLDCCHVAERKSILIIERTHVLSSRMYRSLEKAGAMVIGPVCSLGEAKVILESMRIDGVVLDSDFEELVDVEQLLGDERVPMVYACNLSECRSGEKGCYRLQHEDDAGPVLEVLLSSGSLNIGANDRRTDHAT